MARVTLLKYEDGTQAFQLGDTGEPFVFLPEDEDGLAIAFTKAVNEGIENGTEIEGEAALEVAEVLKAAASGDVVWNDDDALNDWRQCVQGQLPKVSNSGGLDYCSWYVDDISLDGSKALIVGYENSTCTRYVAAVGRGTDGAPVLAPRDEWIEVAEQFVAKAGRMFSGKNLAAMRAAHEALAALIAAGDPDQAPERSDDTTKATGDEMSYTVTKADSSMRYTLGPLYAPMRKDAHAEYIEDDVLHKSLHDFVRDSAENGRKIQLQHGDNGDTQVGEWVEAVRWPYEHTIKMRDPETGDENDVDMPAGTVYLGVIWDEAYWDVEKNAPKGLKGYSLGGRAVKVRDDSTTLKDMGYKVRKAAG